MRLWISSFVVLLVLAEVWQWFKGLSVPFPVFVVAGALLAIASNFDRVRQWTSIQHLSTEPSSSETLDAIDVTSCEVINSE